MNYIIGKWKIEVTDQVSICGQRGGSTVMVRIQPADSSQEESPVSR